MASPRQRIQLLGSTEDEIRFLRRELVRLGEFPEILGETASSVSPPDLILFDVEMPLESGESILARLRRLPSEQPAVVLITGRSEQAGVKEPHRPLEAEDYIARTFDVELVRDALVSIRRSNSRLDEQLRDRQDDRLGRSTSEGRRRAHTTMRARHARQRIPVPLSFGGLGMLLAMAVPGGMTAGQGYLVGFALGLAAVLASFAISAISQPVTSPS